MPCRPPISTQNILSDPYGNKVECCEEYVAESKLSVSNQYVVLIQITGTGQARGGSAAGSVWKRTKDACGGVLRTGCVTVTVLASAAYISTNSSDRIFIRS
jgi:hypothetical protein